MVRHSEAVERNGVQRAHVSANSDLGQASHVMLRCAAAHLSQDRTHLNHIRRIRCDSLVETNVLIHVCLGYLEAFEGRVPNVLDIVAE
jgi:hypothetical protein